MMESKEELEKEFKWLADNIGLPEGEIRTDHEKTKKYIQDTWKIEVMVKPWKYRPECGEEDIYNRDGYMYFVIDLDENDQRINCVSEDLRVFQSEEEALMNGLIEGMAFVDLYKKNKTQAEGH